MVNINTVYQRLPKSGTFVVEEDVPNLPKAALNKKHVVSWTGGVLPEMYSVAWLRTGCGSLRSYPAKFEGPDGKRWATLPETNSSPLKMDGWNTSFHLGRPIFRGFCC